MVIILKLNPAHACRRIQRGQRRVHRVKHVGQNGMRWAWAVVHGIFEISNTYGSSDITGIL